MFAPPLLSGSIQDNPSWDPEMTTTVTERGGDGARAAVSVVNGATRAYVVFFAGDNGSACGVFED